MIFKNNITLKVIFIFLFYYITIILLSSFFYLTIGKYLVTNTDIKIEYISFIDILVYLICLLIFYMLFLKKIVFKQREYKKSFLKNLFFIILIIIAYKIFSDPFYRYSLITGNRQFPEFKEFFYEPLEKVIMFSKSVLLIPILEELVFRKLILNSLLKKKKIYFSILFSSLLFSLIHFNFLLPNFNYVSVVNSFFLGMILSIIFIRFGILYSILAHFFYNLIWFTLKIYRLEYWKFEEYLNYNLIYWVLFAISFLVIISLTLSFIKKDIK